MMRRTLFLLLTLLAVLPACRKDGFRHDAHVKAAKGACDPCHGADPSAPRPPAAADCAACHKEAPAASSTAAKYAAEALFRRGPRPHAYADVIFSHKPHAGAGVGCGTCHVPSRWTGKTSALPAMGECLACHRKEGVPRECAACHRRIRKNVSPPSHASDWEARHGDVSRTMAKTCAYCHDERSCASCHATRKPRSHVGGWDKSAHGLRAVEDRTPCAVCHEAAFCNRCHSVPPPSHFVANFRFGAHRAAARFNPRSCTVCHERSFCVACHPAS